MSGIGVSLRSFPGVLVLSLVLLTASSPLWAASTRTGGEPGESARRASESFATRGVVRSFGPQRKYVNIAHEKIPGYMEAMTMSFEPRSAEQLASLAPGDRVTFTFTTTTDGRRLIDTIQKS